MQVRPRRMLSNHRIGAGRPRPKNVKAPQEVRKNVKAPRGVRRSSRKESHETPQHRGRLQIGKPAHIETSAADVSQLDR